MRISPSSVEATGLRVNPSLRRTSLRRASLALLAAAAILTLAGCASKVAEDKSMGAVASIDNGPEPLPPSRPTPYVSSGQPAAPPFKYYQPPRNERAELKPVDSRAGVTPVRPAAATIAGGTKVTVEKGDTLFGLAKRHNVKVDDLKKANNLTSETIKVGQSLTVPRG